MNKYYQAKLQWQEPKEGSDQMVKKTKNYLVRAESVTEAEARMVAWVPGNYQDAVVKGVQEADIIDIVTNGESETWWHMTLSDENEKGKFVPFTIAINGGNEMEVLKKATNELYRTSQFEGMKRYKVIVDSDLVSDEIPKAKAKWTDPGDAEEDEFEEDLENAA